MKGFIVGMGKIIPGVSGSMLAISLGIYEQLLSGLSDIRKEFINRSTFLIKVGFGILIAIVFTSKIVVKCLDEYYLSTMLLFIGMIIGGIPSLVNTINFSKRDFVKLLFVLIIQILLFVFVIPEAKCHVLEFNIIEFVKLIGIGVIDALSSIVPGISGTALLMMFGYYDIVFSSFSTLFDFDVILKNVFVLIPFFLGFLIGIIVVSKILTFLFKNFKKVTYIFIIAFSIASVFVLFKNLDHPVLDILKNIPLLLIGYFFSRKLNH